ncbi:MAG: 4-hydroxy-tetrahydrodipicolinate reductase [Gammaproteobacteria bacterium]
MTGAATEAGHESIGADAGSATGSAPLGISITDDPASAVAEADVAVDFTLPAATAGNVAACVQHDVERVIGTTGLSPGEHELLDRAGRKIAVVYARNMSVGVNVITELARLAGIALDDGYDVEISEMHHRGKVDAPSGTALQLGEAVAGGRGVALDEVACYERHGQAAARERGSIGFASLRGGSIIGDHSVMFASDGEIVELRHRAVDRGVFALGALRAARWVVEQSPGLYSMNDVLGLRGR